MSNVEGAQQCWEKLWYMLSSPQMYLHKPISARNLIIGGRYWIMYIKSRPFIYESSKWWSHYSCYLPMTSSFQANTKHPKYGKLSQCNYFWSDCAFKMIFLVPYSRHVSQLVKWTAKAMERLHLMKILHLSHLSLCREIFCNIST